jgi:hypothetical protein
MIPQEFRKKNEEILRKIRMALNFNAQIRESVVDTEKTPGNNNSDSDAVSRDSAGSI